MKATVKTSRTTGLLEKMFRTLNARYFDSKLPEPIITITRSDHAYGSITVAKVWDTTQGRKYNINIGSGTLGLREVSAVVATLQHEMCHEYALENGIKDTSGAYHNKTFKAIAEQRGLIISKHSKYGWTITEPALDLLDLIEENGWTDFEMNEGMYDLTGFYGGGKPNIPKAPKVADPAKPKQSYRKWVCPKCGLIARTTKDAKIGCWECMELMIAAN